MKKEPPGQEVQTALEYEYSVLEKKVGFTFSGRKIFRYNSGPGVGREGNF